MEIIEILNNLSKTFDDTIKKWHEIDGNDIPIENLPIRRKIQDKDPFFKIILEILEANYNLWHLEDLARDPKANDTIIANVKRKIDKENQLRNDRIENFDILFDNYLKENNIISKTEISNSETPGSIIDRLSILSLKIYHMYEQTLRKDVDEHHINSCQEKLKILYLQRNDLAKALTILVKEILNGEKKHKIYYQFKMYNNPALNPVLYKK